MTVHRLPSLRSRILWTTLGVTLLVAALFLPLARHQIARSFNAFEAAYAAQEQQRLQRMLQEVAATLGRTAIDYSRWIDTVEFIAGDRPQWVDDNLTDDVFSTFKVSHVLVADAALRPVETRAAPDTPPLADPGALLKGAGTCAGAVTERRVLHRFQMLDDAPHVVVCSPIMEPEPADAPVVGVLLWLLPLDADRVAEVTRLTQFPFSLHAASEAAAPGMHVAATTIELTVPVADWNGVASISAHVTLPRPLGAQRTLMTRILLTLLAAALIALPMLILVMLETTVVRQIKAMSQWVRSVRVGDGEPLHPRQLVPPARPGFAEIGMLGEDVSDLARGLESSRADWRAEALRDSLTGLGNRPRLIADLEATMTASRAPVALLLADLDSFKSVNDLLGHPAGDLLLEEVAQALGSLVPPGTRLYRLGGDEFAILLAPASHAASEVLARTLVDDLRFIRGAAGKPLAISACVGVALTDRDGSTSLSELIAHSDLALYEAKRAGRATWRVFSPATDAAYRDALALESGLRQALADGALEAWFQPIVDAGSRKTLAFEALARWFDPIAGWISPARFIPIAEATGQILEVDLAVFEDALRAFASLHVAHPDLSLHINASARSLADPGYIARLEAILDASVVAAHAIAVELTESDLGIDDAHLQHSLAELRRLGLQLVVDDFGVGASSLGRLAQVRPVAVKIDGSFVRDMDGNGGRVCRAIVELARELGMASVAEYVETDAHAQALLEMRCDALQGYGVAAAMRPADAARWLAEHGQPIDA